MAHGIQQTPAGKVPLDYLLYLRGVKSTDFAKQVGVSDAEMSRYRNGLRPPENKRKLIARKLKVTLAELGWEEEPARV